MRATLILFASLAACSTATTDNFQNPPPGPPATCAAIASLPGCDQGSLSFACSTGRPDGAYVDPDTGATVIDTNLVCSAGTPGGGGERLFCCAPYAQADSDCAPKAIAGCVGTSIGFACSGQGDPPTTPSDADPTIACSAAIGGSGVEHDYCCNTAAVPPTCALDPSVVGCTGVAIGYSCVGTDAPSAGDASLACSQGQAGSDGATGYCCIPFARDAATCDEAVETGCAGSAFGFACDGSDTPDQIASELTCAGVGSQGGDYCCTL